MPYEPIYVGSALLQNRTSSGCPKSTDISGLNIKGVPIVYDLSLHEMKQCSTGDFKIDANLSNTNGCCVVDNSGEYCTDYTGEKSSSDMYYDMGVVYFKNSDPPEKGQRKICYTTPIRKRRVKYMEIIYDIFVYSLFLILIAIQAACYEYWMINGQCDAADIATALTKIPYSVNEYPDKSNVPTSASSDRCKTKTTNDTTIDWYSSFPYNLITFINEPDKKEYSFDARELVKIPVRGFLLGFFYCVIISRIFMKAILSVLSEKYFNLVENRKNNAFLKGVIFVLFFMGLYGNIAYFAGVTSLPGLNATTLLFFLVFGFITIWIGGFFGMLITLFSFLGYRKDLRNKHKEHENDPANPKLDYWEQFVYSCNSLFLVNWLFWLKRTIVPADDESDKIDLVKINNIEDKVLDWFYPIRLDELRVKLPGFLNIDLKKHGQAILKNYFEEPPECNADSYFYRWVSNSWDGKTYEWYNGPWRDGDGTVFKPKDVKIEEAKARVDSYKAKLSIFGLDDKDADALDKSLHIDPCGSFSRFVAGLFLAGPFRLACLIVYVGIILGNFVFGLILKIAWFFIVFYWVFTVITCGVFGNMIAFFYLHFYFIIGFFYTPLSNYYELFEIIKSHGNILTLLFCAIVVQAGVKVLDPISSGIIGGLFAILVVYKLIVSLNT